MKRRFVDDWRESVTLGDETTIELRLMGPLDRPLLAAGFAHLSPESRYRRFFVDRERLTDEELAFLTQEPSEDHVAIGAVALDPIGRERGVGVARWVRFPDERTVAEPAVAVIDELQGKGLGRLLLERLVASATERGVERFRSEILASNAPMRALLAALPAEVTREELDGDVLRVEVPIGPGSSLPSLLEPLAVLLRLAASGWLLARRALDGVLHLGTSTLAGRTNAGPLSQAGRTNAGPLPQAGRRAQRYDKFRAMSDAPTESGRARALEAALAWLPGRQAEMERLLAELVEISSHTPDTKGTSQVAERYAEATLLLGRGALHGGTVASASAAFGRHVVLRTDGDAGAGRGRVLLVGHHDTVFPAATFAGFREDGALLRGPGVLDMKGGLVVIAYALGALAEAGLLARVPLSLVSISDEEVGSPEGRRPLLVEAEAASCALVFESGRASDEIVTRRKGLGGLVVTATGKAAHAGNAHREGANALWAMARFVDGAQGQTDYARGITVNVGKLSGGMGKNTVPDRAEALVDFRFLTKPDGEALLARLRAVAEEAAASVPGTSIAVAGGVTRMPLERSDASAALLAEYAACAAAEGLGTGEAPLIGGGSDANTVSAVGVPAIDGLGPRGKGFHTVDELIERATLVTKARALVRFLAARAA